MFWSSKYFQTIQIFFSNFHISTHIHTNNKLNHLPLCHTWILLIICSVSILLDWSLSITSSTAMSVTSLFAHWWIALPWSKAENYVDSFVLFLLSPGYIYAISLSLKQPIGLLVIIYLNYFKIILNVLLLNKQNKVETGISFKWPQILVQLFDSWILKSTSIFKSQMLS